MGSFTSSVRRVPGALDRKWRTCRVRAITVPVDAALMISSAGGVNTAGAIANHFERQMIHRTSLERSPKARPKLSEAIVTSTEIRLGDVKCCAELGGTLRHCASRECPGSCQHTAVNRDGTSGHTFEG
jgi:hypothetical protein